MARRKQHLVLEITIFNFIISLISCTNEVQIDTKGYVVYCPCMGRFGNQADHFLGSLAFAKHLDRTLVLPPWVEYGRDARGIPNVTPQDFDKYFSVSALLEYHRVIVMRDFMKHVAPSIWPENQRIAFCWSRRRPQEGSTCPDNGCCAKTSSPFGPFWEYSRVDFVDSLFFGDTISSYDVHLEGVRRQWMNTYPASKYPVLAFTGAPAEFPVTSLNRPLHQYLRWSDEVVRAATDFLESKLRPSDAAVLGVHFRNDVDWNNVCDLTKSRKQHLFASKYCLGDNFEYGQLTMEVCAPSFETIVKQLRSAIERFSAKLVFVAADKSHMIGELQKALSDLKVTVITRTPDNPHISLAILSAVDYYIGNCVSSFSNFAARERWTRNMPYGYWGVDDVARGIDAENVDTIEPTTNRRNDEL